MHNTLLTFHWQESARGHNKVQVSLRNVAFIWVAICYVKLRKEDSVTKKKDRRVTGWHFAAFPTTL